MKTEHTPEPWIYTMPDDFHCGSIMGRHGGEVIDADSFTEDNARRIVACVNWCAGNSTEGMVRAVEIGRPYAVERDSAIARELELIAQRDELLAALEAGRRLIELISPFEGDVTRQIDKAIACVKEK